MTGTVEITDDLAACHALRRTVFIEEQGIAEPDEWDDLDADAVHLLARIDGRPVATARLLREHEIGKIGRICVLEEARGTGLGAALVRFGLAHFEADPDITRVELGAQAHAEGFYRKLGFIPFGDLYDDAGIPHRMMRCTL